MQIESGWRVSWLALSLGLAFSAAAFADTAQLHNTTGLAYYYQGKDNQAYDEFVKALELDPSQAEPHYNLGRLFERQTKFREALEQYRQALELDPSMEEALRAVERLQGQPAGAPGVTSPASVTSESDLAKLAADVKASWNKGDKAAAQTRLQEALAANPNATPLLLLDSEMQEKRANIAGAIQSMQKARTVAPTSPQIATRLSMLLYRAGLFDQSSQEAERAISLNPSLALPYRVLGLIMLSKQKPVEANSYFAEALRLDPSDEIAKAQVAKLGNQLGLIHYNNGIFYFQNQDWAHAKEELKAAIEQANLTPEQMAVAQQYLVIADFSAARVAQQIKQLQEDRRKEQEGRVGKAVTFQEANAAPNIWAQGQHASFDGYIVATSSEGEGSEILVTRSPNEILTHETPGGSGEFDQSFRASTEMTGWFTVRTPKPLPVDERIRPTSRIHVEGFLTEPAFIRNPYNLAFSRKPEPVIKATYLEINRELAAETRTQRTRDGLTEGRDSASRRNPLQTQVPTPFLDTAPGPAGPLRIDYLQFPPPKRRLPGS